jgi:phage tail sheath protein FI
MPEYLAPGVYVEEVSFRAKSIEGVSTTVTGFIGPTRFGPVGGTPELLTSYADFERIYGGIDGLTFTDESGATADQPNFMAHAVRAFFDNGGSKLYVTRVFQPYPFDHPDAGHAQVLVGSAGGPVLRARFPGQAGNMRVVFAAKASANLLVQKQGVPPALNSAQEGDVVFLQVTPDLGSLLAAAPSGVTQGLYDVSGSGGGMTLTGESGTVNVSQLTSPRLRAYLLTVGVRVLRNGLFEVEQAWDGLSLNPDNRSALLSLFTQDPQSRQRYLEIPFAIDAPSSTTGAALARSLLGNDVLTALGESLLPDADLAVVQGLPIGSPKLARPKPADLEASYSLVNGGDGMLPIPELYRGQPSSRPPGGKATDATGLETFADIDEISMVAAPGYSYGYDDPNKQPLIDEIVQELLTHCELMRYRVALLDSPDGQVVSEVQAFRGQFDSTRAALYYPWITIIDPTDPDGRREINVPPSGYVAGICARSDVEYGVAKAPANEVVLGAIGFETLLNKAQQDILNPLGVNCFRFFEGRGYRLWGARTISSDPEWKYLNVRRYFAYLEHSIDRGTQWAVFENNGDALWANVRRTVEDFLLNEWRNGALLGQKPEQAYFVRCDRSTMSQNDLDNGRLVCLVGVSVLKPAEYVIFRIGQMTADAAS